MRNVQKFVEIILKLLSVLQRFLVGQVSVFVMGLITLEKLGNLILGRESESQLSSSNVG